MLLYLCLLTYNIHRNRQDSGHLFYKIITGLAQVPFEGVIIEAYKGGHKNKTQYDI